MQGFSWQAEEIWISKEVVACLCLKFPHVPNNCNIVSVLTEMIKQEFQNSKENCNMEQAILRDDSFISVQGTECGCPVHAVLLHPYTK